jgi:sorbitol/mannitol transport system permease protein
MNVLSALKSHSIGASSRLGIRPTTLPGILLTALTYALALIVFFPILWLFVTAFKTEQDAVHLPPLLVFAPTLSNFRDAAQSFGPAFWTTLRAVGLSTILAFALGLPAAYALADDESKWSRGILLWILGTKMMPPVGIIVPLFLIYRDLSLLDTELGLIVIYTAMNVSLVIWLMTTYFSELPIEIFEAGRLEGLGPIGEFIYLGLPLVVPGIVSTALLCIILAWNEFLFALVLSSVNTVTVSVFITSFKSAMGLFIAKMSAASILAIGPVLVLGWVAQRRLVRGLTLGAVK